MQLRVARNCPGEDVKRYRFNLKILLSIRGFNVEKLGAGGRCAMTGLMYIQSTVRNRVDGSCRTYSSVLCKIDQPAERMGPDRFSSR